MKSYDEFAYAKAARAYFKSKRVYKYRMKRVSGMTDQEVIEKCHAWQEENDMVDDYWNFAHIFQTET